MIEFDKKEFLKKIKNIRKEQGFVKSKDMALKMGMTAPHYSEIETAKKNMTIQRLSEYKRATGVNLNYLLSESCYKFDNFNHLETYLKKIITEIDSYIKENKKTLTSDVKGQIIYSLLDCLLNNEITLSEIHEKIDSYLVKGESMPLSKPTV